MTEITSTVGAIKRYVLAEFLAGDDPSLLQNDTELVTTGILDSLAVLKLVTFLEEEFGVTIPPAKTNAQELNTVESIAQLVDGLQ